MLKRDPYKILLDDPAWGPECRTIESLEDSPRALPAVVGGCVRDLLLGRPITDLDIATAYPDSARNLAAQFADATDRKLVEYTHKQAIYRVVAAGQPQVDFTDPVGDTRRTDLLRRDFTINALALGLVGDEKGKLQDPTNGAGDLEKKIVRATSPDVFDDDPLRVLRAFRFSAELEFSIDRDTLAALSARSSRLSDIAGERIQLELLNALSPDGAADLVVGMDDCGVFRPLFPELGTLRDVDQNDYHHLNVWEHTLDAIKQIEKVLGFKDLIYAPYIDKLRNYVNFMFPSGHSRRSLIKLAVLLHDICKPACRGLRDDGRITFIGHETQGAELVDTHLERLKFPRYERQFVRDLIRGHLRPAVLGRDEPDPPRTAYRFFRDYGESALAIILISLADRLAAQGPLVTEKINEKHREAVAFLLRTLFERAEVALRPPRIVDGATLMRELCIKPGPIVGYLLRRIREAQVMGEVTTEGEALDFCRKVMSEGGKETGEQEAEPGDFD
jgi:tRNA nucleotidyltransferase/poly(A) polymerase